MDQLIKKTIETDFKKFFYNIGKRKDYVGDVIAIKVRKLKGCNLDTNGPTFKFNMVPDQEYGIIKTKFRILYDHDHKIPIGTTRNFDTLFIIILNKGKGIVEKVYAIPEKELDGKRIITIVDTKYQRFKINEKPYNEIYCYIKTGKYSIFEDDSIAINHIGE
jgi:hypothetical protein